MFLAEYEANEVIIKKGDEAHCMYVVIQGEDGVFFDDEL